MQIRSRLRSSAEGAVAGAIAGVTMNAATTWFLNRQSQESRDREEALSPGGVPGATARRLLTRGGFKPNDELVEKTALGLHWMLPVAGGIAVANLTRGRRPLPASITAAVAMWALFDEIAPWATGTSASPDEYPLATHARGLVGHVVFGAALGTMLSVGRSAPVPSQASAITHKRLKASPEKVFDVLLDPGAYIEWVVGARELRAVDDDWPAPGSAFHHRLARASGGVADKTVLVSVDPPKTIVLKGFARPFGVVDVAIQVDPDGSGCVVSIEEKLAEESGRAALNPIVRPLVHVRNVESLRRLERVVAERTATT